MKKSQEKKFVFLAHWVENWNWWLWYVPILHRRPGLKIIIYIFFPLYFVSAVMSLVYHFSRRAYDVVDSFTFSGIPGETWLVRSMAWSFLLSPERIKQRILYSVLDAQEAGASVIGLGALTKNEKLTKGGEWIVEMLGDRLKVPVIHGDTLTAATVIAQTLKAISLYDIQSPVFITGATSKIGRAVALSLAQSGIRTKLYTSSFERFLKIQEEAGIYGKNIIYASSLKYGIDCRLWLTGKAKPKGMRLRWYIPRGAVVINFAVPNPLGERAFLNHLKFGITAFEGGLMMYDPALTNLKFTMRLIPSVTYACHAGTVVHDVMGWKHHEVGQVELAQLQPCLDASTRLGFALLPLPKKKAMKIKEEKSSMATSSKEVV